MNEFMLLIYNKSDHQKDWSLEIHSQFLKKCEDYILELKKDGKLISAQPLIRDGIIIFGTTKNWTEKPIDKSNLIQVGYYHILADNIEDAINISKRNPEFEFSSTAKIEVRPIKTKEITTGFEYPKDI